MAKTSLLLLILLLVCGLLAYLYYDAFSTNQELGARVNEMQKQVRSLRIDKEDTDNRLSIANGKVLQVSHELEAEKGEVRVKKAEVKKLTERINTMKNEQEMSERARITAERKMQSAEQELQQMKTTVEKVEERAQEKEDNLEQLRGDHEDVTAKLKGCLHEKEELQRQLQAYEKVQMEALKQYNQEQHHNEQHDEPQQHHDEKKSDNP